MTSHRLVAACRLCNGILSDVIYEPNMPIAGQYLTAAELGSEPLVPLSIAICGRCGVVQLREAVDEAIYRDYRFVGSVSSGYRAHLEILARELTGRWGLRGRRAVEIGCNDGTLLELLRDMGNNRVFGWEPSTVLQSACIAKGLNVETGFFNLDSLASCPFGQADFVVLRHVLEHINDPNAFMFALAQLVAPDGFLVVEVPDLDAILERDLFSHFYHEHVIYYSAASLAALAGAYGFTAVNHHRVEIHGGSILMIFQRVRERVALPYGEPRVVSERLQNFAIKLREHFNSLGALIADLNATGLRIGGYGAAHRTVVACTLGRLHKGNIRVLIDRNSHLHGLFTPGSHIPIAGREYLDPARLDAVVLFATSFEKEIMAENKVYSEGGGRWISISDVPRLLP